MKKIIALSVASIFAAGISFAQPQPPHKPNDAERLKHVTNKLEKELTLSAVQKEKVTAAYKAFFSEMEKNKNNAGKPTEPPPPPPPPVKREIVEKLAKQRDESIQKVLTNEQYKKYIEVEKKMRPSKPPMPQQPDAPKN